MNRRSFLHAGAAGLLAPRAVLAQSRIEVARFSALRAGDPLPGWLSVQSFDGRPRHTEYSLVQDEGRTVLRAEARAAASGLARELRIEPAAHPILAWRWKVMNLIGKSDLATQDGDDFPARIYVTFALDLDALPVGERLKLRMARLLYGPKLPLAALCYVWDGRAPAGTVAPNAYTDRVRMVVVESGAARLGRWVDYQRDVPADYRSAFGLSTAPVPPVNSVVFSSDTDNTGESAIAYFGDAEFRARPTS